MKGNDRDFAINSVLVQFEGSGNSADDLPDPARIDAWSYSFDNSGRLVTILRWMDWRLQILAIAEHDLGTVKSESLNAETYFTRGRLRNWQLIELQHFSGPGLVEANDLNSIRHSYLSLQN